MHITIDRLIINDTLFVSNDYDPIALLYGSSNPLDMGFLVLRFELVACHSLCRIHVVLFLLKHVEYCFFVWVLRGNCEGKEIKRKNKGFCYSTEIYFCVYLLIRDH